MTKVVRRRLGRRRAISFRANWDIETDWDYAYLEAQVGRRWQNGADQRLHHHQPQRPELRLRHHRRLWRLDHASRATLPAGTTPTASATGRTAL